ncbi:hypothetical protein M9M37_001840 [Escherichia coli]|nr:hypothetical protein [Escherichia coli]MDF1396563.1 hypothetical protein [Escherichia coli]HAL6342326.1 hypothetical protein [Escherichia coli]HAX4872301.1 hypothetical protein [Escherichia coli]HDQ3585975.1 hypothetical protein [Escherichia coli]
MSKTTYLHDLHQAYKNENNVKRDRCRSNYKNMPEQRWREVMAAHNRRVQRKRRRSVGKSNKFGVRRLVFGLVSALMEFALLCKFIRLNKKPEPINITYQIDDIKSETTLNNRG